MICKVHQRNIHISHRKAQLVCDLVRNKPIKDALIILKNTNKKIAPIIHKLLSSAVANATHNHAMNAEKLYVYSIVANQGPTWKRTMPRARGSADMVLKRTTHLRIELSDNPHESQLQKQAKKSLVKTPKTNTKKTASTKAVEPPQVKKPKTQTSSTKKSSEKKENKE